MDINYERLEWEDFPSTETPINADNLNHLEEGIAGLYAERYEMQSNIAYVEDGETASKDYLPNSYLMRDGLFYKVTKTILYGDSFDSGEDGNIEHVDVSSQFGSGGGGSTGCVELTQAQYDALSDEAKMLDVIYLITDSPDNYLDEVFGDFATVEYTDTASKAYAVGDYLVHDSKFYKVTTAIAQGDTIVPDTNVVKTTVGGEVNELYKVFGDFATVESTTTASKGYSSGDLLVLNSKLYRVTSGFAQGATIVPDTNVVETTVSDEIAPILIVPDTAPSATAPLIDVLQSKWSTRLPADTRPRLVRVDYVTGGAFVGYLNRYVSGGQSYGSGLLTKFDGTFCKVKMVSGTVTVTEISNHVVLERRQASYGAIAAGAQIEVKMDLSKSGYTSVPGYAFTVSGCIVNNIYNQNAYNDGRVQIRNMTSTAVSSGTVYVNMVYVKN